MPPRHTFEFVSQLEPEQKKRFEQMAHDVVVRKGKAVIDQGPGGGTDVYFVVEGEFEVRIYSSTGKEVFIREIGPGAHFGELAALDQGRRSANVIALTEGKLKRLSGKDFVSLLEASPKAGLWLGRQFASQIRVLTERIFELCALDVRGRLRSELLRLATASEIRENRARIYPAPTHNQLANKLGTHREGVTRELRELVKLGWLTQRQREIMILDVKALEASVQRAIGEHVGVMTVRK
jgi:CRP/FNR family transcriptional regulator, cyclic AMP receptor protein